MGYTYDAFGLRFCTNLPIRGLAASVEEHADEVEILLNVLPDWFEDLTPGEEQMWYRSPYLNQQGEPILTIWQVAAGEYLLFRYDDGVDFVVERTGTRVWGRWPPSLDLEDAITYLLGDIIASVLEMRGLVTVHASAVAIDGFAVAFAGPQGSGKSTTVAALAERRWPVLVDDIVAIEPQSMTVRPGYPQLNLWPSSVEALYGHEQRLPRLTPNWDKRYLALDGDHRFQHKSVPLGAIYFLAARSVEPWAPRIWALPAQAAALALVRNGYVTMRADRRMRARYFDLVGRVAEKIPLREVTPHSDLLRLPELCDAIVEDARQLLGAREVSRPMLQL